LKVSEHPVVEVDGQRRVVEELAGPFKVRTTGGGNRFTEYPSRPDTARARPDSTVADRFQPTSPPSAQEWRSHNGRQGAAQVP
jgi:hypothetical protein